MEHQITAYEYDGRGLLTKVKDASDKVTVYDYDENGNLISVADRDGNTTNYEYDPTNLLKQITYDDGKEVEFEYNAIGQLIQMQDWLGTTSMELDPLGRLLKVTDFENKITEYGWTPSGQKEFIKYPDGSQVSYTYDKTGKLKTVADAYDKVTQYNYNDLGNLIECILPSGSKTEYAYDKLSQIKELTHIAPTGKIIDKYNYTYDAAGNKTNIYKNKSDLDIEALEGEDTENIKYKYDSLNQLTEVIKNNQETRKYFYDTLGNRVRLEEWSAEELKEAVNYQYDIMNRLVNTNDVHSIIQNQTLTALDISDNEEDIEDDNKEYKYDKRGNLLQISSGGKVFNKYEFDATNALAEVISKHKENTKYTYDGFGNRVKTTIDLKHPGGGNRPDDPGNGNGNGNNGNAYGHENGNNGNGNNGNNGNPKPGWGHQNKRDKMEINYAVDITSPVNDVLMTYGSHYQVQRYTYGLDRISMDMWELEDHDNGWIPDGTGTNLSDDPERLYYLQDELGSTIKVIGEDGKTSAHYNYDEFGRPQSARKFDQNWPGPDNTFGYTGYQYDVSSGLYYAQARYYMPETGRFISEDPWTGDMTTPQTLNPYPYVVNNPLNNVDPLGLRPAEYAFSESEIYSNKASVIENTTANVIKKNSNNDTKYSMCDLKEYMSTIQGTGNAGGYSTRGKVLDTLYGFAIGVDSGMAGNIATTSANKTLTATGKEPFSMSDWEENPDFSAGYETGKIFSFVAGVKNIVTGAKQIATSGGLTLATNTGTVISSTAESAGEIASIADGARIVLSSTRGSGDGSSGGFDKQRKGTPGNNQAQNKQFNDVVKELKLNKSQQRELHDAITGQGYTYQELLEEAKSMFDK